MSVRDVVQAAAGALGGEATYVEDVFGTYLYTGNGSGQVIENGIALGDTNAGPCVPFNGSQYLSRTSDFVGNSDGSTFTLSFWALITNTYSTIFRSDNGRVEVYINSRRVAFDFKNTSGTSIWRGNTATNTVLNYQWYHILISVTAGGPAKIYINDNNVTSGISYVANTSGTFDFTDTSWGIGAYANGSLLMAGKLTEFFFDKTYRDLDIVANRRLFITADGEPATGLASLNPLIYLPLNDTVSVGTNEGTGGDLVPINGLISSETGGPYTEAGYGQGGLVWLKSRSASATNHQLFDTERGVTKELISNSTAAEATDTDTLTAFNADGFSLGADSTINTNAVTYTSWTFRKAEKFFDVVTYTGTGSVQNISHNLGSVPGTIIVKRTDAADNWFIYHQSNGTDKYLRLNTTDATTSDSVIWNNTLPTSSAFTLGASGNSNRSGATYVAYLFAHDAGGFGDDGTENIISCGSYTGNASDDGPEIDLGFEPQWLLIKNSQAITPWVMFDNMRGIITGGNDPYIQADTSDNERTAVDFVQAQPTGFKVATFASFVNTGSQQYIYIAIRRGPMKTPEAGTEVFAIQQDDAGGTTPAFVSGFPVDVAYSKNVAGIAVNFFGSRLQGANYLRTNDITAETANTDFKYDYNNGWNSEPTQGASVLSYMFRRAPSFMDVVAYTGNGTAGRTVPHNLGVVPEMMIVKRRSGTGNWVVYSSALTATKALYLNTTSAQLIGGFGTIFFNDTAPTATVFSLGTDSYVNLSGSTYVNYLFTTLDGISKVGSYTGTAADLNVDCGFSAGARFILIKRTDSTGDWYVWDSVRGITAGNDPYLLLNSTAAEVTGTDYIDPLSSGFTVTSSAPAALNASGGSYIFLAIA